MRRPVLITSLLISLLVAACDSDEVINSPYNAYLPLTVGNYWEFRSLPLESPQTIVEHREVMGKKTINNKEYFLLVSTWPSNPSPQTDSVYYRIGSNGFAYSLREGNGNEEENRFRLDGIDGDAWSYEISGYKTDITLTASSVNVGGYEIDNCKAYYRDVLQMADEEFTVTLAPGYGFLKEYSNAWGGGQILKSVRIDGRLTAL